MVQWAPYADLLGTLPALLCGPTHGGTELVLVLLRLEDLVIAHPEARHAPITKESTKTFHAPDTTTPPSANRNNATTSTDHTSANTSANTSTSTSFVAHNTSQPTGEHDDTTPGMDLAEHIYQEIVGQIIAEHVEELQRTVVLPELERQHRENYGCADLAGATAQIMVSPSSPCHGVRCGPFQFRLPERNAISYMACGRDTSHAFVAQLPLILLGTRFLSSDPCDQLWVVLYS